jgi:methionine-gamma-lyase
MYRKLKRDTLIARTYLDGKRVNRTLSMPLYQGTVFAAASAEEHAQLYQTNQPTFYQRFGHPNSEAVAEKVAALEGAERGLAFSSGMAAISATILTLADPQKRIVVSNQYFEQTERLLGFLNETYGVSVFAVDTTDLSAVEAAVTPDTAFVYIESPSNPHLRISDIAAISKIAGRAGKVPVIVDSTFATPYGQQPLDLGASLVIHSGTKFLSGHSDVMCGFVAGPKNLLSRIHEMQVNLGGVLDPHAAWLAERGIKTLGIRMERIGDNALRMARYLEQSELVDEVRYPLLEGSAGYAVAQRQMTHGGGVISFRVKGGNVAARSLLNALELIQIASSLGGVETTIEIPCDLDWYELVDDEAEESEFADPALIRISVGLEDADELIEDLAQGLEAARLESAA